MSPAPDPTTDVDAGARRGGQAVQSVDRALRILEILARDRGAGVTAIAAELDVHKSTASRLLASLEQHDLVVQDGDRGTYALGFGIVRLAGATVADTDLAQIARPACERLVAEVGETANVAILGEGSAINVCQAHGTSAIGSVNWVGRSTPLHATSSGLVLLAHASQAVHEAILAGPLERFTDRTVCDRGAVEAELDAVRTAGWAATHETYEVGLHGIAAPVRGADGAVCAALSVAGPEYRLGRDRQDAVVAQVRAGADALGRRLGFLG